MNFLPRAAWSFFTGLVTSQALSVEPNTERGPNAHLGIQLYSHPESPMTEFRLMALLIPRVYITPFYLYPCCLEFTKYLFD